MWLLRNLMAPILALGLCLPALADDPTPAAKLDDSADPASAAVEVNTALGEYYSKLRGVEKLRDPKTLIDNLKRLESLDAYIRLLGVGVNDVELIAEAKRSRSLAWLHGWASFSILLTDADSAQRSPLLTLDVKASRRSALDLLLSVYRQIRSGEVTGADSAPNPLQSRLSDATDLVYLLKYQEDWRGRSPETISHRYYIPSTEDLVGKPRDGTGLNNYKLVSLWTMVNLQLDTWRDPSKPETNLQELSSLVTWLDALARNEVLVSNSFEESPTAPHAFTDRIDKLHRFIKFRAACMNEERFDQLLTELKDGRTKTGQSHLLAGEVTVASGPDMKDLVLAATPIGSEVLPHAEILLRYVVLLSFRDEGVDAITKQLTSYWSESKLPGRFLLLSRPTGDPAPAAAFARWNQSPGEGHFLSVLSDATFATYRHSLWQSDQIAFDKSRLRTAMSPKFDLQLAVDASERVRQIRSIQSDHTAHYFDPIKSKTAGWSTLPADMARSVPSRKRGLAIVGGAVTPDETKWVEDDLLQIATRVDDAVRLNNAILSTYRSDNPAVVGVAFQSSAGSAFQAWNPNALPSRTFRQYADELKKASEQLRREGDRYVKEFDLKSQYNQAASEVTAAEAELRAARWGLDAAEKGQQIADIYDTIGKLQVEIATLNQQVSNLMLDATKAEAGAADKALVLATRARDLAAAQLEGLNEALSKAKEMIQQASAEMEAMQPRLREIAKKIRDSKNSFFKILKCIISVVGAALGPITGGITSIAAALVNQAIDIARNVSSLDFGNFAQAAVGIAGAVVDVGNLGDQVISKFGGADLQKTTAEVKSWINSTKGDIERVGNDARKVIDGLKGLEQNVIGRYATAMLNDLPITVKDNTVHIELGPKAVELQGVLKDRLNEILQSGGVISGDLKARVEGLAKLPLLDDDSQLKTELKKAVDQVVVVLPDELLAKAQSEVAASKKKLKDSKDALQLEIDKGSAEFRKSLAKLLGGGLTVVLSPDGTKVLAIERPINKEAEAFERRLKAVKDDLKFDVLGKLADSIQGKMKVIQDSAADLQKKEDDAGLEKLADSIPGRIDEIKAELDTINNKIIEAQGKLEDANIGVDIATFHKNSLDLMVQARVQEVHITGLKSKVADLDKQRADLLVQQAALVRYQHGELLRSKEIHLEQARAKLRSIYQLCRLRGIDPTQTEIAAPSQSRQHPRLVETLTVKTTDDPLRERLVLDSMAEALFGMLQWIRLLDAAPKPEADDAKKKTQFAAMERLNKNASTSLDYDRESEVAGLFFAVATIVRSTENAEKSRQSLATLGDDLDRAYARLAPQRFDVVPPQLNDIALNSSQIEYFDAPIRQTLDSGLIDGVPEDLKKNVIGRFQFRFTTDPRDDTQDWPWCVDVLSNNAARSYFFLLNTAVMVKTEPRSVRLGNYRFLVVPAVPIMINHSTALAGPPRSHEKERRIVADANFNAITGDIKKDLDCNNYELRGAEGNWIVYILSSSEILDERRSRLIAECKSMTISLCIPALEISRLPASQP